MDDGPGSRPAGRPRLRRTVWSARHARRNATPAFGARPRAATGHGRTQPARPVGTTRLRCHSHRRDPDRPDAPGRRRPAARAGEPPDGQRRGGPLRRHRRRRGPRRFRSPGLTYLSGRGTPALTVTGLPVTLDATRLSDQTVGLAWVT